MSKDVVEAILKRIMVALQLWVYLWLQILSKVKIDSILDDGLLFLQLALVVWKIMKLTPVGVIIQGGMGWLLSLPSPSLFPDYALLRPSPGRVFKKVGCDVVTNKAGSLSGFMPLPINPSIESMSSLSFNYFGENFQVRKDENKLFVDEEMSYYISDKQWVNIGVMTWVDFGGKHRVLIKGYTRFWDSVDTGGVMTFKEVLDCIIVENQTVMLLNSKWFMSVNMSLSGESNKSFELGGVVPPSQGSLLVDSYNVEHFLDIVGVLHTTEVMDLYERQ